MVRRVADAGPDAERRPASAAGIHDRRGFIRLGIGRALREPSAVEPDGFGTFVQRHPAQFTKAMLAKARLADHGRRMT